MFETITKVLRMFGKDIQEKATEKLYKQTSPGDQYSVFTLKDGIIGFKPYLIIENQNETVLYSHNCIAVDVRPEVELWLLDQPPHLWKYAEETDDCHVAMTKILVNEEVLTWMTLRWA